MSLIMESNSKRIKKLRANEHADNGIDKANNITV